MIIKHLGTTLIIITSLAAASIAFPAKAGAKHGSPVPKVRILGNHINLAPGLRQTNREIRKKVQGEVKRATPGVPRLRKPPLSPGRHVEKSVNRLNKSLLKPVRSEKRARSGGSRHSYSGRHRGRQEDNAHNDRYRGEGGHARRDSGGRHRDADNSNKHGKHNGRHQGGKRHHNENRHYRNQHHDRQRHNYYRTHWYNTYYLAPIPYYYYPEGRDTQNLPKGSVKVVVGGIPYFYFSGTFYKSSGGGYVVVSAPYGAIVKSIPTDYVAFTVELSTFYYVNDTYYVWDDQREAYIVSNEPVGAGKAIESATKERLFVYPKIGQDEKLQAKDRYECHRWAVTESGVDPTSEEREYGRQENNNYKRAISACLVARDYSVK